MVLHRGFFCLSFGSQGCLYAKKTSIKQINTGLSVALPRVLVDLMDRAGEQISTCAGHH
jgi:hypothetical protein